MAIEDIRLRLDFFDHRKTKQLETELGLEGVICLLRLWCYAAGHKKKGILYGMDREEIARAAHWFGHEKDASLFVDTLFRLKLLELDKKGIYKIHEWSKHQDWVYNADKRSKQARDAAIARHRKAKPVKTIELSYAHAGRMPSSISSLPSNPSPAKGNGLGEEVGIYDKMSPSTRKLLEETFGESQ